MTVVSAASAMQALFDLKELIAHTIECTLTRNIIIKARPKCFGILLRRLEYTIWMNKRNI
jgi:hypothetical protein